MKNKISTVFVASIMTLGAFTLLAPNILAYPQIYTYFDRCYSDEGLPGADGSQCYPRTADIWLKTNGLFGWPTEAFAVGITEMNLPQVGPAYWNIKCKINLDIDAVGYSELYIIWGWSDCPIDNNWPPQSAAEFCDCCYGYQVRYFNLEFGTPHYSFVLEDTAYRPAWQGIYAYQVSNEIYAEAETFIDVEWFQLGT